MLLIRPHPFVSIPLGAQMFALYGQGATAWFGSREGLRLHVGEIFGWEPDVYVDVGHVFGFSNGVSEHGVDTAVGVSFPFFDALYAGPVVHMTWLDDPDGTPVWMLLVGLNISGWPGRGDSNAPDGWVSHARRPHYVAPSGVAEARSRARHSSNHIWLLPDLELFGVHALDDGHRNSVGFGAGASASVELPFLSWLGVHVGVTGMVIALDAGRPAAWVGTHEGVRFHWTDVAHIEGDGWIDIHHVYGVSSGIATHGADLGAGYMFDALSFLRVGPTVRATVLADPGGDPAVLLSVGLTVAIRGPTAGPGNADGDRYLDRDDCCGEIHEGQVEDPNNPGCPLLDRDSDGVPDDQDMCSTEPAGDEPDPEHLGCPLRDRDHDGVADEHDFCPADPAGANGGDPLRDGCPLDAR